VNTPPGSPESERQPYVRQETFLAHYPRRLKLAVTVVFLLLAALPWLLPLARTSPSPQNAPDLENVSAKSAVAAANNASAPAPAAKPSIAVSKLESDAISMNDADDHNARMAHAPDPGLTEDTAEGELPRISEDGRKVWQVYARPFNTNDKRPRVAMVLIDMGMARMATDAALRRLPAAVTIAFDAQSPVVGAWLARARQDGHETLLSLPMEPFDYPRSDPGPGTLLTNLPNSDNFGRLIAALRSGTGYVGVTTISGSRFTADPDKMTPVLDVLKRRGLLVFDAHVAPHSALKDLAKQMHLPVSVATLQIDRDPSPAAIDSALNQLEQTANLSGHAIGVATPLPVTLDHLETWIKRLPEHGLALAPISAVVE
jgi:polysaccharide deacetylase 2 family uncharacterized protein YibQ